MSRRRLSGEEARARILDAAGEQLRITGPSGLRLDPIAEELGVSRQALLHHFGTRDGLIAAVVQRGLDDLQTELATALAGLTDLGENPGRVLERAFEVIVDGVTTETIPIPDMGPDPLNPVLRLQTSGIEAPVAAEGSWVVFHVSAEGDLAPVHPGRRPFAVSNPIFLTR